MRHVVEQHSASDASTGADDDDQSSPQDARNDDDEQVEGWEERLARYTS